MTGGGGGVKGEGDSQAQPHTHSAGFVVVACRLLLLLSVPFELIKLCFMNGENLVLNSKLKYVYGI